MNKKFYRAMTLGVGLLLAGDLAVNAQKITFNGEQVSLKRAFEQIESVSNYKIAYNTSQLDVNRKVTLNQKNTDVLQVLDQLLAGTGCTYKVNENYIVITAQQAGSLKKIHGVVKDVNGEPIIGANVVVKGSPSNGTITDFNGNFDLSVTSNATLQISYIGYNTQELFVGKKTDFNIVLKEDTETLEEVVVVGYGTMKKKDLTGAVASVKMDDAPVGTVSTISHALAGKAAGLQVNTISAQPGSGSTFRIRGAASVNAGNDPLIIIDGFPVSPTDESKIQTGKYDSGSSDNILASINPNDIESIEVLKDASSTAIYGARAGNGVIIITTKKGKTGAPKVTYSGTASVQTMAAKYEMLSAKDFMIQSNRYALEEWRRSNGIGIYGGKSEAEAASPYTPYYSEAEIANPAYDTDWFKEITRTGFQTQHNLSVNGGTETTKYLISGNFFKQDGVVKNNDMDRYTARVNVEQKVSKYVNLGVNMTLSRNTTNNVPLGAGQNENASIMVAAAQFSPILPVRDENGEYVLNSQAAFLPNPVSLLEITDKTVKERLLGTAYIEIKPIEELTLKGNFGIDRNYQKHSVYMPKTTLYGQKTGGQANIAQYDKIRLSDGTDSQLLQTFWRS